MKSNLIDSIDGRKPIELSDRDSLGSGISAEVFRYVIQNTEVALKCFKEESPCEERTRFIRKNFK